METTMKTLTLFGALLFGLVVVQASADARESLRKNETYCLESSQGGGSDGGGTFLQCRYETMAQCIASKTSQGDLCSLNPVLAFRQQGKDY
jgi:hypothetical protein